MVAATQYKVLTQGDMELPEYIEKCRRITDAFGWPEEAKDMALRNTILLGLKNSNVYRKCLEEDQDSLTAERVIQIATLIYNSDCQRSIMADSQYGNGGSYSHPARINAITQSPNKASKRQEIGRGTKQRQDSES